MSLRSYERGKGMRRMVYEGVWWCGEFGGCGYEERGSMKGREL